MVKEPTGKQDQDIQPLGELPADNISGQLQPPENLPVQQEPTEGANQTEAVSSPKVKSKKRIAKPKELRGGLGTETAGKPGLQEALAKARERIGQQSAKAQETAPKANKSDTSAISEEEKIALGEEALARYFEEKGEPQEKLTPEEVSHVISEVFADEDENKDEKSKRVASAMPGFDLRRDLMRIYTRLSNQETKLLPEAREKFERVRAILGAVDPEGKLLGKAKKQEVQEIEGKLEEITAPEKPAASKAELKPAQEIGKAKDKVIEPEDLSEELWRQDESAEAEGDQQRISIKQERVKKQRKEAQVIVDAAVKAKAEKDIAEAYGESGEPLKPAKTERGPERGSKMPERKKLWEVMLKMEKEKKGAGQEELNRVLGVFGKGERVYDSKKGEYYKLDLENIKKNARGKMDNNSELTFTVFDKDGKDTGRTITKKLSEIQYSEWKKPEEGQLPENGQDIKYRKSNGEVVEARVSITSDGKYELKFANEDKGSILSPEELRRYKNNGDIAFARRQKTRLEAAEGRAETAGDKVEPAESTSKSGKKVESKPTKPESKIESSEAVKRQLDRTQKEADAEKYLSPDDRPQYEQLQKERERHKRLLESAEERAEERGGEPTAKLIKNYEKQIDNIDWKTEKLDRKARWAKEDYLGSKESYENRIENLKKSVEAAKKEEDQGKADRLQSQIDRLEKKANPPLWKKIVSPSQWLKIPGVKQVANGIKWASRRYPITTMAVTGFSVGVLTGGPIGAILGAAPAAIYGAREMINRDKNGERQIVGPVWFNKLANKLFGGEEQPRREVKNDEEEEAEAPVEKAQPKKKVPLREAPKKPEEQKQPEKQETESDIERTESFDQLFAELGVQKDFGKGEGEITLDYLKQVVGQLRRLVSKEVSRGNLKMAKNYASVTGPMKESIPVKMSALGGNLRKTVSRLLLKEIERMNGLKK